MKKLYIYVAFLGDTLFILWILYNAVNEGFKVVRPVEAVALSTLAGLLILNIALLWNLRK